jgi:hypothetical protein
MPSPSSGLGVLVLNWAAVPPTPRTNNTTCASRWWRRAIVAQRPRLHSPRSGRSRGCLAVTPAARKASCTTRPSGASRLVRPGPLRRHVSVRGRRRVHTGSLCHKFAQSDRIFSEVQRQNQNLNKVKSLPSWRILRCMCEVGGCVVEALFSLLTLR